MDRGGLARFLAIGALVFAGIFLFQNWMGESDSEAQPLQFEYSAEPKKRSPEKVCEIWTQEFRAQLSTKGASLKRYQLLTAKYLELGEPIDLSTTPDQESRQQLRFHWRNEGLAPKGKAKDSSWQVAYDTFDWRLTRSDGKSCTFRYQDDQVELEKHIATTKLPYELTVTTKITNRAKESRRHALSVETTAWRIEEEVSGQMFRMSPYMTTVECVSKDGETTRLDNGSFDPDDFTGPEFAKNEVNPGDWHQASFAPEFASVSNMYFSHALLPKEGAGPVCQLQVEKRGAANDPNRGAMYRARLAYPKKDLAPGESASYSVLSYIGPKERDVLAAAAGGNSHLSELIDLGFFSDIAKVLVAFLLAVYSFIPNWGVAIIILTITARTLLFPLSLPSIKNMVRMRQLKPQIDALNEKYKDDPQQKGLAQMELWRKEGVNPFKGCLPQIASMPVWFALYTTLQTAVELFNIPFLWFPDLSKSDPYYILPFVIGATTFAQQKLIPQQGDPAQQKMMLYFMPGMFVVFMFFLPSGLGVYMFTNGLIGIAQQQLVEWHARRKDPSGGGKDIDVKVKTDEKSSEKDEKKTAGSGKKKKRKDEGSMKISEGRPLLDKGRA